MPPAGLEVSYRHRFRNKKVAITGGLGFIGSNIARKLVELEAEVLIIDSLLPDYGGNLFNIDGIEDRVQVNISDIRDAHAMRYLVRGQDYIFNLAGQISHIDSMSDPFTDLEINVRAQLSLLEACRHNNPAAKIIFASTRQIYGKPDFLPVNEQHLLHPPDVNGVNKMAGEWYHIVYQKVYGLRTSVLRLTNTYGPRQLMKHNRQGFIGWFIRQATLGEEIQIWGDGKQKRDLNYVDDVVEAFLRAAVCEKSEGKIYNLGNAEPVTLLALAKKLAEISGKARYRVVPFPDERKSIDIGDVYSSYEKINKELGWQPEVSLAEGLTKTIAFYRQFGEHYWS